MVDQVNADCYGYQIYLFLRFFDWILELFRLCGIFRTVQTVCYFLFILLATEQNITFLYIIVLEVLNRIMISDIENEVKKEHKMKQNELLGECSHCVFLHRFDTSQGNELR